MKVDFDERFVIERLHAARAVAWSELQPAFDHAIALAREAEHLAGRVSIECQTGVQPDYPPLVLLLAAASPDKETQR
ncbi:hypothetical protein GS500_04625 [Rhodococcus hoagii]|nr:hypothetical protein [Prescottella equi]